MRADQCLLKSRCHDARRVGRRATRRRQHRTRYRARSYQKKGPRGGRVVRSEDSVSRLGDVVGAVPDHRVPSHRRWALTRPSVYQEAPIQIIRGTFALSSVIDNQFLHAQAADVEFVDLDDAEAGPSDRQSAENHTAESQCANRDSSDRERSRPARSVRSTRRRRRLAERIE